MTKYQGVQKGRKYTGGRLKKKYDKKLRELGRPAAETTIANNLDEVKKKKVRVHGGKYIFRLFKTKKVNAIDPETGKAVVAEIMDVEENTASNEYRRRDIITKGAVLETSVGLVKVTNRPGNEGFVNGIILKE